MSTTQIGIKPEIQPNTKPDFDPPSPSTVPQRTNPEISPAPDSPEISPMDPPDANPSEAPIEIPPTR